MSVYFIRAGESGPVKIGFAAKVSTRFSKMQADNHERLEVLRVITGDHAVERQAHRLFAERRIRGEWFRFDERMLSFGTSEPWMPENRFWYGDHYPEILKRVFTATRGVGKLADVLGITAQAICQWNRVPAERVGMVAAHTGIPLHELRPDLFPGPKAAAAS